MIRLGQMLVAAGIAILLLPWRGALLAVALVLIGLGCAPIYPSIIHATPKRFGDDVALELTGMQMAFAYVGSLAMSPLFGAIAQLVDIGLYPLYMAILLAVMVISAEKVNRATRRRA